MLSRHALWRLVIVAVGTIMGLIMPLQARGQTAEPITPDTSQPFSLECSVTAYYSPLPDQEYYWTGSYEGDISLNGNGTNGASGVQVYLGMVAAPATIPFDTVVYIEGWGVGEVQDRGGAINGNRVDIWMGKGDEGLARAINWGRRTTTCTFFFPGVALSDEVVALSGQFNLPSSNPPSSLTTPRPSTSTTNTTGAVLKLGSSGPDVVTLQEQLKQLGYFSEYTLSTGNYGSVTAQAVFEFQVDAGIVKTLQDVGAGQYGPTTRTALLAKLNPEPVVEEEIPSSPMVLLQIGSKGDNVKTLQEKLQAAGYYSYPEITGYYGDSTKEAVYNFQVATGIVRTASDMGAGQVGPITLSRLDFHVSDPVYLSADLQPISRVPDYTFTRDLSVGVSGDDVTVLQQLLTDLGYDATGFYGPVTKEAVCQFQIAHGIVLTCADPGAGIVGPKTREALNQ